MDANLICSWDIQQQFLELIFETVKKTIFQ